MPQKKPFPLKPLFIERMKSLPSKDFDNYLGSLNQQPLKSIRCNTLKISPKELKTRLEDKGWIIKQPFKDFLEIMIIEGKKADENNELVNNKTNHFKDEIDSTTKLDNRLNEVLTINNNKINGFIVNNQKNDNNNKLNNLSPGELGNSLEHLLGYYYVQDIASMLPPIILSQKPNEIVLDLCASPGSKTTQLGAKMQNKGLIIANDAKLGRLKILSANLERCGVSNTIITKHDGIALCKRLEKTNFRFDKILIDAPCSGEGTICSAPKTSLMWNIKTVFNLSRLQKALIASAISILKPNGELVYSTCTHAPEENEEVIDFVLKNFPEMKTEKINLPIKCDNGVTSWQDKKYSEAVKLSCRIYPHKTNTEGFFIAKLKRH